MEALLWQRIQISSFLKIILTTWNNQTEEWYFSVQDVVAVLTDSKDPKHYIKKMRTCDPELNSNWGTICTPVEVIESEYRLRSDKWTVRLFYSLL